LLALPPKFQASRNRGAKAHSKPNLSKNQKSMSFRLKMRLGRPDKLFLK
jgi:hypothetical protein